MKKKNRLLFLGFIWVIFWGQAGKALCEESTGFFNSRKTFGLLFIGGGALLAKQGLDFRNEADRLYGFYRSSKIPEEADRLYARTNNRDIKSQLSFAMAGAFVASGFRLIFFEKGDGVDKMDHQFVSKRPPLDGTRLSIVPVFNLGGIGVVLRKEVF